MFLKSNIGLLNNKSNLAKTLALPLLHVLMLFLAYKILFFLSIASHIEDFVGFKQWDAFWYSRIAEGGYVYSDTEPSNSGFFPLFPYMWKILWKLTNTGVDGVCIFNFVIFILGMLMLKEAFQFSWACFMLFLSLPSNMFMYVPYTEGAFFFFSAVMLAGLKKKNQVMIYTGLFLASITRPTALFFIPAIICMEIFVFENFKKFLKNVLLYSSVPLLGILVVTVWQYKATGVWFAYFKAQSIFWKRSMQMPGIPLTTWDGPRLLWIDGLALFFGMLALGILIVLLVRLIRKKDILTGEKAIFFSLCYVMMATVSVVFFNGKVEGGATSLYGANRYVFANPFFIMMLLFITQLKFEKDVFFLYIITALLTVLMFRYDDNWFAFPEDKFYYGLLVMASAFMYLLASARFNGRYIAAIYLVNIFAQMYVLCVYFLRGIWIG